SVPSTSATIKLSGTSAHHYLVRVRATDVRGHNSHWVNGRAFTVGVDQENDPQVGYAGTFTQGPLAHASGGNVAWSTDKGAKAVLTFTGQSVALVSTRGPDRGKAKIYIDGDAVGTVKLGASTLKPGSVVFAANVGPGHHTIGVKVVGKASSGKVK